MSCQSRQAWPESLCDHYYRSPRNTAQALVSSLPGTRLAAAPYKCVMIVKDSQSDPSTRPALSWSVGKTFSGSIEAAGV